MLAAGAGSTSDTWAGLAGRLTGLGTVVTFDRAGIGRSSASSSPRSPTQIASELLELLDAAELEGPYVLVGHSAGGWHALRFAEQFPERVLALVLVDTPPADFETRRLELLTPREREERVRILDEAAATSPGVVSAERRDTQQDLRGGFAALPVGLPFVVVAADEQEFGSERTQQAHRDLWLHMSRSWLALSANAQFIVARGSGHMIHHEQPELLVKVIRDLVAGAGPA